MDLKLPQPVAAYFTADRIDAEAVARCFTDNGVVKDEGRLHKGLAAIRQWKSASSGKYSYTSEPFAAEEKDGRTIVTSRVTGTFPGSPVDLRYFFSLEGDRISSLEISP